MDGVEPGVMEQWVIYDHPADHPGCWVVRRWFIGAGKIWPYPLIWRCPDLETARETIEREYPSGSRLPRQPDDDPVIFEVWI